MFTNNTVYAYLTVNIILCQTVSINSLLAVLRQQIMRTVNFGNCCKCLKFFLALLHSINILFEILIV